MFSGNDGYRASAPPRLHYAFFGWLNLFLVFVLAIGLGACTIQAGKADKTGKAGKVPDPIATIAAGGHGHPVGVAITPDGQYVYTTNIGDHDADNGTVSVIATAKNTACTSNKVVGSPIKVGKGSWNVAITPDGQYAYVSNHNDKTVSVIATAENAAYPPNTLVGKPIKVGTYPDNMAITPDGQYLYVVNAGDDRVSVIATAKNRDYPPYTVVGRPLRVGDSPGGVAITPDGQYVYVANASDNSVRVIATANNLVHPPDTVVGHPLRVGHQPVAIAITPDGQYAYVANNGDLYNPVSVIATAMNTTWPPNTVVGAPIRTGESPGSVTITPDGRYAYVVSGNGDGNDVVNVIELNVNARAHEGHDAVP